MRLVLAVGSSDEVTGLVAAGLKPLWKRWSIAADLPNDERSCLIAADRTQLLRP